jgi:hypothetical protein
MGDFLVVLPAEGHEPDGTRLFQRGLRIANEVKKHSSPLQASSGWVKAAAFRRRKGSGGALVSDQPSGTFLIAIGTWFHDDTLGPGDEERLLELYLRVGAMKLADKLKGFFIIVIADARTREVLVITDLVGSCPCYARNFRHAVALSGSSFLLASLEERQLDAVACQEFLATGIMYEDRTFYREVRKLGGASVFGFRATEATRQRYWKAESLAPEGLPDQTAISMLWEALQSSARQIGHSFQHPVCDLTGGYDSRTLVAACVGAGVPISVTVSGPSHSPDVMVARELAQMAGLQLIHTNPEPARNLAEAQHAFPYTDGEYDVVDYARILGTHEQLSRNFDISLNGSYGEVARGYWWELLVPFTGKKRKLDAKKLAAARYAAGTIFSLFPPELRISMAEHMAGVVERTNAGLENFPNTFQIDHAYLQMRMQCWQGRIARSTNQLWPCLSPFMLRPVLETMLQARAALRTRSRMVRIMLARYAPRLANIPLEHGYPAVPASWNNLHRFYPLAGYYAGRAASRIARRFPRHQRLPAANEVRPDRLQEMQELLNPDHMRLASVLDRRALQTFLAGSQNAPAEVPQWRYLFTLEYTMRALTEADSLRPETH